AKHNLSITAHRRKRRHEFVGGVRSKAVFPFKAFLESTHHHIERLSQVGQLVLHLVVDRNTIVQIGSCDRFGLFIDRCYCRYLSSGKPVSSEDRKRHAYRNQDQYILPEPTQLLM